jgi:hypothetical protein
MVIPMVHVADFAPDALEQLVRERDERDERDAESQARASPRSNTQENIAFNIISLLAKELPKLVSGAARTHDSPASEDDSGVPSKRRRVGDGKKVHSWKTPELDEHMQLPEPQLMDLIIDAYFSHVHPWIPMVHRGRFLRHLDNLEKHATISVLLHAMIIAAARFVSDERVAVIAASWAGARDWLVSTAMHRLSVENMQALIMIAFTDVSRWTP